LEKDARVFDLVLAATVRAFGAEAGLLSEASI
jgi:hypothetical protein